VEIVLLDHGLYQVSIVGTKVSLQKLAEVNKKTLKVIPQ
jgi:hypothetical protein